MTADYAPSVPPNLPDRLRRFFSIREHYLQELRGRWGRPIDTYRDRSDAALLHVLTSHRSSGETVDDATWNDLDLDALFDRLDGTTTRPGRQYLYRQLRTYEPDEGALERQHATSVLLREHRALREEVQLRMWRLRGSNASAVTVLLFGELPDGRFSTVLAACLAGVSILSILAALTIPGLFWLPILPVLANFVFAEAHSGWIGAHSTGFVQLRNLLTVARRLCDVDAGVEIPHLKDLKRDRSDIRRLRRRCGHDARRRAGPTPADTVPVVPLPRDRRCRRHVRLRAAGRARGDAQRHRAAGIDRVPEGRDPAGPRYRRRARFPIQEG